MTHKLNEAAMSSTCETRLNDRLLSRSDTNLREAFELDAAPYEYDLTPASCSCCQYEDEATQARWLGWRAALAHKIQRQHDFRERFAGLGSVIQSHDLPMNMLRAKHLIRDMLDYIEGENDE